MNSKTTIFFNKKPTILEGYSVVGPKEKKSELGKYFDFDMLNDMFNEKTFEKAERKMLTTCIENLICKAKLNIKQIDLMISGDLLDQNISSNFTARELGLPFLGVYSACSTFTESILIGASMINAKYVNRVVCSAVSHFSSAERQYRFPLELGSTRPPQAQWTTTGAGAIILSKHKKDLPYIDFATFGRVVDYGVTDAFNMGSAMAPAGADTLFRLFSETNTTPKDYDLILSGDLGALGSRILKDLMMERGFDIEKQHVDCGELIYNLAETEYQGGSGAGCSATVFSSYIYNEMKNKKIKKVILMATGALLSTLSSQQGESIPSIAHAVCIKID